MRTINEAIRSGDFSKASGLVLRFLRSKTNKKVYAYPIPDTFTPSGGRQMTGVRYFVGSNESVRLNWVNTIGTAKGLKSIDYWDGSKNPQPYPSHHVEFDVDQSLAKVLPFIADFLNGKINRNANASIFVNESIDLMMVTDFSVFKNALNEATYTSGDLAKTLSNTISALQQGLSPSDQYKAGGQKKYGVRWAKIIDAIKEHNPEIFEKQGVKVVINKDAVGKIDSAKILKSVGADPDSISFTVSDGKKETSDVPGASDEDIDRLTYEEQLESLKTGVKLLVSGATNLLVLGGRGGVGKTATVEDVFKSMGKTEDNKGYVKIAGSASPAGIYRILFKHRNDIILFDDADSAFVDQESRNLFKAATDTKKIRKVSWQKGGKNYIDADDYDWDAEDDDLETLPRSFEFTGRICMISNLQLNKLDPDGALRTRGFLINIDPTNQEIYDFLAKIIDKIDVEADYTLSHAQRLDVLSVVKSRKIPEKTANLRTTVRALNVAAGVLAEGGSREEWAKFVLRFC